jgi:pseudaminic acid biosynthesis-associated methylase
MNEQQNFWAKEYAIDYIVKNSNFNHKLGVEAWVEMIKKTSRIQNILECGCNIGRNIQFLNEILPNTSKSIIEISKPAFDYVKEKYILQDYFNGSILDSKFNNKFDLVYTMGVLIHIHPKDLNKNLEKIFNYSSKYILIGEYFNRTIVSLNYQGQKNKLFKMDFGKLIMENFPVELVDYGFLWGHIYDSAGFDDITWWLFIKK